MTGYQFERFAAQRLADCGFWVHRVHPDEAGRQPFDLIAAKGEKVYGIDCKVVSTKAPHFPLDRVEINQRLAMERLIGCCTCAVCGFLVLYEYNMYFLPYDVIRDTDGASIKLTEDYIFKGDFI